MRENINIRTVKDLEPYLDDKIDKLASSEEHIWHKSTSSRAIDFDSKANRNIQLSERKNS